MYPFTYTAVTHDGQAVTAARKTPTAMYLAGGTNLVDEMKLNLKRPTELIDINGIAGLDKIEKLPNGGLRIGALVKNSDLAYHPDVMAICPVLSQALLSGASPQLRNMATVGGNLLQKTRCTYYRDLQYDACNKRNPGSGCAAIDGVNRIHALFGTSEKCIATHPSDMCVALVALDATIDGSIDVGVNPINLPGGVNGNLTDGFPIKLTDFYVAYGEDPAKENVLPPGRLITHITIPPKPWSKRSLYVKARDRASYAFALSSAAVVMDLDGRMIRDVRLALGGVASKPWRATAAEAELMGREATDAAFTAAADAAMKDAKPQKYNAFKIELTKRVIVDALRRAAAMS